MVQQKAIFPIFKKSNMATVMAIFISNLQLKYCKACLLGMYGQYIFIFTVHVTHTLTRKTHIINLPQI